MKDSHPSHHAGKGSQPRPYDPATYAANYDLIFRKDRINCGNCRYWKPYPEGFQLNGFGECYRAVDETDPENPEEYDDTIPKLVGKDFLCKLHTP